MIYNLHIDDANKASCLIVSALSQRLKKQFINNWAYDIYVELKGMFEEKPNKERLDITRTLLNLKPSSKNSSVCQFILDMKGLFERLEELGIKFDTIFCTEFILAKLPVVYNQFIISYQMRETKTTSIMELHNLLQNAENSITK